MKAVLLDLDGTLIDTAYCYTVPIDRVVEAIAAVQARGVLVGLHSDTPLQPLRRYAAELGMNGPLLAEKGQVLEISRDAPARIDQQTADFFTTFRRRFIADAISMLPEGFAGLGDVTEFVRQRGQIYGADQKAILVNGYRQCSFSAYALRRQGNSLVPDLDLLDMLCGRILELLAPHPVAAFDLDRNPTYGIVILHEKSASKTTGIQRLQSLLALEEIAMVGDGDSDVVIAPGVRVCAVENSTSSLKECVQKTGGVLADQVVTEGVLQILKRLEF